MRTSKLLLFLTLSFHCLTQAQHFIFHFDINKTLIAEDIGSNKTVENVIIECLAEKTKGMWDSSLQETISFSEYVKEHLLPGKKTKKLKQLRREQIHAFLTYLKEHNDPRYTKIHAHFEKLVQKVKCQKGKIFNAFYQLISYLDQRHLNYTIILRTFGEDLALVSSELSEHTNLNFEWEGSFRKNILYITHIATQQQFILESLQEMNDFFKQHRHIKIQDDFDYWHEHGEQSNYGKLLPLEKGNSESSIFFFDDNADNNIIHPCDIASKNSLSIEDVIKTGIICVVDTLGAIEDDLYFVKHIEKYINFD